MTVTSPVVVLDQVSYQYPGTEKLALRDISIQIEPGEFVGVIGPTGAGKTTLCLSTNGIVPQFQGGRFFGHIRVAGLDTIENPVSLLAQHVGIVMEDPETQLIATSVENEVAFALENLGVPRTDMAERIKLALAAVRLSGMERRRPHDLSGGEKQRLSIAAAIAVRPELLVLDEPTSQLDPAGERDLFAVIRELNQVHGVTVLLASHAAEFMAEFADRILLLSAGEVVLAAPPEVIYSQVNLLAEYGLRSPEVAEALHLIRARGIPIPQIPVTLERGYAILNELSELCRVVPMPTPEEPKKEADTVVCASDLWHVYPDGTEALKGVSLNIHRGEYVLLVGQNGAGKTTLVKHFHGLLKPTRGSVTVHRRDVRNETTSGLARKIGYVAQNPDTQIFCRTVEDEVSFALRILGYPSADIMIRTRESLKAMGLMKQRQLHPLSLPKGDRARVVVAAVLAMNPDVIILDEPTTGQDHTGARKILDTSKMLHEMGKTIVVITHHLYLMAGYADRAIVMGKGVLLLEAPVRQVFHSFDVLDSTFLVPPQSAQLAHRIGLRKGIEFPAVTPRELAESFYCDGEGGQS